MRSYDRRHTLRLIAAGVDFEMRETFESALAFGRGTLEGLGLDRERAAAIEDFIRRRDLDRLALQQAEGLSAGTRSAADAPGPARTAQRAAAATKALTAETEEIIDKAGALAK